jgi:hypothetical protein
MIKFVMAAVISIASPLGAMAAPFCLVLSSGAPQCIYFDGAACAHEASRQNGACQPNAAETHVRASRIGEYCLVMPSGYSTCGYSDGNECARDAIAQKGACSRSAGARPRQLPDAYEPNAGR